MGAQLQSRQPSLMALTLSVGFVVDDAIVMLRTLSGTWRWEAPRRRRSTAQEILTIIDDGLAGGRLHRFFMGGIVGRLMHEFAVTIGASILVSVSFRSR